MHLVLYFIGIIKKNLRTFTNSKVKLMLEWVKVMGPVAISLDKIQSEERGYLGCLLLYVVGTITMLREMTDKQEYCSPLVHALLTGTERRFRLLMEDQGCLLAAVLHPLYQFGWLEKFDKTKVPKVRKLLEAEVEECLRAKAQATQPQGQGQNSSHSSEEEENADLASRWNPTSSARAHIIPNVPRTGPRS